MVKNATNLARINAENRERLKAIKAKLDKTVSRVAELKTISFVSRNNMQS